MSDKPSVNASDLTGVKLKHAETAVKNTLPTKEYVVLACLRVCSLVSAVLSCAAFVSFSYNRFVRRTIAAEKASK